MAIKPAWIDAGTSSGRKSESAAGRASAQQPQSKKRPELRKVLPEVWALVRPRRWLLAFGLVLMVISRVASFVLPLSAKYLIDNVMRRGQIPILPWIIGAVLLATAIQGVTSYGLTQLLS